VVFKPVVTKKEIVLEKKVKGLSWNRVLLMPKEAPNRVETVWDKIKEVNIDITEIVSMFEIKVENLNINFYSIFLKLKLILILKFRLQSLWLQTKTQINLQK